MRGCRNLMAKFCMLIGLLTLAACQAPATLSSSSQYARIGILPAYEPEVAKRTPPGLLTNALVERLDLDLGLNRLVAERAARSLGGNRQVADLQPAAPAYIGAPKVHSAGERKIIGDSRPLFTEVVRSMVGQQGLDAYVVIEGGPVWIYEPQVAPAVQMLTSQGRELSVRLNIYVIDGRTFEVAAASRANLVQRVPEAWFVSPRQHAEAIRGTLQSLLDQNLESALRKLGL
jgi:hypothetical protein